MLSRSLRHNRLSRKLLEAALRYRCQDTRAFVFVANAGRSGSRTLADLFAGLPGVAAFHEPTPKMTIEPNLSPAQSAHYRELFYNKKVFYVLRAAAGHSHYIETNHLFIKTFARLAIEYFGNRLKIVHLRREPIATALSFYQLGEIPGRSNIAAQYMLATDDPSNVISLPDLCLRYADFGHPFYACLWYWYEIEARIARLKTAHPQAGWHLLRTEDLNSRDAVARLCHDLRIERNLDQLFGRVGLRSNLRLEAKRAAQPRIEPLTYEEATAMHDRFAHAVRQYVPDGTP